jgi:hypothetical protein
VSTINYADKNDGSILRLHLPVGSKAQERLDWRSCRTALFIIPET